MGMIATRSKPGGARLTLHMRKVALFVCITGLMTSAVCQQLASKQKPLQVGTDHQAVARVPQDVLAQISGSLQQLAANVSPAVVQIEVSGLGLTNDGDRKNTALVVHQHAIGSGVIVDSDGYIITNAHVIEGAQRIRAVLTSPAPSSDLPGAGRPRVLDAALIGTQKEADLALLKVNATNLPALRFSLNRDPQPGELVFAIGSPEGLQNSVTMGVISSVWRQPDPDNPMAYLQTDAPINPGNSGGPLVDINGALIGINTFILSSSGGNEGLGFAIPAPIVNFVYQSLKKYGRVDHVEIGAVAQMVTPTLAQGLGLSQDWGVLIADVVPYGPADMAGIKAEDIVLAVDGQPVQTLHRFTAALYRHPLDQVLQIDVLRRQGKLSFNVPAIKVTDHIDQLAGRVDPVKSHIGRLAILGLDFSEDLRSVLPMVRNTSGVLVIGRAPGFNSANTGLQTGDLIHSLNRTPVDSIEQLKSAVAKLKAGDAAVLQIERLGQFQYLSFEME